MPLPRSKIAVLHVAKKQLGLNDDAWRDLLARVAGVTSSTDLDEHGFEGMMQVLESAGFKSDFAKENLGNLRRWDMATAPQVALIKDLWSELHGGELDETALDRWLARFGADALRFLNRHQGRKAIAALKSWKARLAEREAS